MKPVVAIIGAGYVGMEMCIALYHAGVEVIAFDIEKSRLTELANGIDKYKELGDEALKKIVFTDAPEQIKRANYFISTVPTPINQHNIPDLSSLKKSSLIIGKAVKPNDTVIFESTVYPGATEELMIPILEEHSQLKCGRDFHAGYSPERVVPGDHEHSLHTITKVISGYDEASVAAIKALYGDVLKLDLFTAPSIKTAESCKLLENIQRDVNIALLNEYAQVMGGMRIKMQDVLEASRTKWNFLPFKPGLVGGHCIPVDPYYIVYQSHKYAVSTNLINTARDVNEHFVNYIVKRFIQCMGQQGLSLIHANVVILGASFKPNVSDTRHSLSFNLYRLLAQNNINPSIYDPIVSFKDPIYQWTDWDAIEQCDAFILVQEHDDFVKRGLKALETKLRCSGIIFDIPGVFHKNNPERADILCLGL